MAAPVTGVFRPGQARPGQARPGYVANPVTPPPAPAAGPAGITGTFVAVPGSVTSARRALMSRQSYRFWPPGLPI